MPDVRHRHSGSCGSSKSLVASKPRVAVLRLSAYTTGLPTPHQLPAAPSPRVVAASSFRSPATRRRHPVLSRRADRPHLGRLRTSPPSRSSQPLIDPWPFRAPSGTRVFVAGLSASRSGHRASRQRRPDDQRPHVAPHCAPPSLSPRCPSSQSLPRSLTPACSGLASLRSARP